ncbi:MAG TPA: chromate resistance protein ChrB domain-containing protein [Candidatus Limnocylindrales bacterium]|nr:chromate resistance protein ChrB domain-containing protein [Candidatus Limnocylindrales bacterium]
MAVTAPSPWLLLVFTLPSKRASARVEIWRKLKKFGALALRTSGYLLPNTAGNQERFEWLAASIRKHKGDASIAQVTSFDGLPREKIEQLFIEERSKSYQQIMAALKQARGKRQQFPALRRRFEEIAAIDFFASPLRVRVERMLDAAERGPSDGRGSRSRNEFLDRTWITRPRPGIDRVSSAWLIQRFIDPNARFVFSANRSEFPGSIPFDMFTADGFGHRGDNCTFETLCREFAIKDKKVRAIARIIHDADLGDDKFGRAEGAGLDRVLDGWARQQVSDEELLRRGIELIEGLYSAL